MSEITKTYVFDGVEHTVIAGLTKGNLTAVIAFTPVTESDSQSLILLYPVVRHMAQDKTGNVQLGFAPLAPDSENFQIATESDFFTAVFELDPKIHKAYVDVATQNMESIKLNRTGIIKPSQNETAQVLNFKKGNK